MSRVIAFSEHLDEASLSVREAGRLGGLALLGKYGRGHLSKIGKKGQLAMRAKHAGMASVWGKRGGRPRKPSLPIDVGEKGTKAERR